MSYYTDEQLAAAAISSKVTAFISFVSSSYITYDILKQRNANRGGGRAQSSTDQYTTMHRILLGISAMDLVADAWFFVGTWAIPVGTPRVFDPRGNEATCTIQGFFLQSGLSIPVYQSSLAAYYYLCVCKSWKEDRQLKRYQCLFHAPPLIFAVATALYGAIDDQFNPSLLWCFFAGTDKSTALLFGFFYAPLWISFVVTAVLMALIYRQVRQLWVVTLVKLTIVVKIGKSPNTLKTALAYP